MTPTLTSQGMVLATAMAVSGTMILLVFRLQKSVQQFSAVIDPIHQSSPPLPRSCISSEGKKKKKKRVHFAEDVVDPIGNSEEYRRLHCNNLPHDKSSSSSSSHSNSTLQKSVKSQEMPANRMALYSGIIRDRGLTRMAYSC
ncbi:uncharacterized protein LOC115999995 [Ipomoea triloba]|uniref:uncharacterized protein LOC115999995 n=1 Tax=Ipomoea triloba TaxID=35885 RepID=UPI00125E7B95|nr:uncharacterized protein LOC115999995 [Ipomoea triloba]GMC93960.1 uncharacterized protein LOC109154724 [Ipomoea batatas]